MNKVKAGAFAALIVGGSAAVAAAAIPAGSVAPAGDPVSGITKAAEQYASSNPTAEHGVRTLIRDCMSKAGFDYTPPNTTLIMDLHQMIGAKRLDLHTAKAVGYGTHINPEPNPESSEAQLIADPRFEATLKGNAAGQPEEITDGYGTATGGCTGEAASAVYGSVENYALATTVAFNSLSQAVGSAMYDPEFVQANEDWAKCMDATPYADLDTMQQARDAAVQLPGQDETKIAVADAVCRERVDLHERLDTVLDKYLTTRMRELRPDIEQVTEIREAAADRAAELTTPRN
jgi:hypothetical protein